MSGHLPKVKRESLGKMGLVLLPIERLKSSSPRGKSFENDVHDYFLTTFNGYTVGSGNISGHWKDDSGRDYYGEHREYRVALPNEVAVRTLELFLATLAHELGEKCVYFEFGEEARLIYAQRSKPLSRRRNISSACWEVRNLNVSLSY